ncbi:D-aminoacyl-tRNA deacylase [Acinetobacter baumannii]|nr:D-aminoacyl-tRNA deacylase [Acinetobacter baumannii]MCJ9331213.1 D-aminoacyl-tRNA deacylase [Acinetobacter baumannii]MCJ9528767.1 D-aminoacyl-tRNA deacylase [Acinetobacter baumannii]MCJ9532585.1 D-aminoacyl-tRNA deacylase [Acinetobacter baumannii]
MLVSRYHPFFWLLNSQLILSSFTKSAIRSLSPCLVKKTSILFETPPENVQTGIFAADMKVHLINDGPVTFNLEVEA